MNGPKIASSKPIGDGIDRAGLRGTGGDLLENRWILMPCMIALGLSDIVEVDALTLTVKVGVLRWVFHASETDDAFLIVA